MLSNEIHCLSIGDDNPIAKEQVKIGELFRLVFLSASRRAMQTLLENRWIPIRPLKDQTSLKLLKIIATSLIL